jgi:pimeloyl-ACP methyl ester carboxylesterase
MTYLSRRTARWVAMAIASGSAGWGIRHATAPSVRRWRAGGGSSRRAGILQVRTFGSGEPVVVLLHGMAGAGNSFGAAFDRLGDSARVVVPDLLGFGGSMLPPRQVSGEDHLDALDGMLAALGLAQGPFVVVGHSMGGPLALRFAARHSDRVRTVVTLCAALYHDAAEADARIALMGPFEAALTGDGPLPERLCAWVCRHRAVAGWVAVAIRPDLPVAVARSAVKHTWDSYRGALDGLLRAPDWEPALDRLAGEGISIVLVEGGADPVPVPGRAAALAGSVVSVRHRVRENATHLLPLTEGAWCAALLVEHLDARPLQGLGGLGTR